MKLVHIIIATAATAIISGALVGLFSSPANLLGWHKSSAEENAKTWAKDTSIDLKSVVCNGQDTDEDGYVSCAFHLEGEIAPRTYECAGWVAFGPHSGCREPKLALPITRRPARE